MQDVRPWNSDESLQQYESLFPPLPDFSTQHTLGGKFGPKIGLPDRHSLWIAEDILAALIAHQMEISVAYARKRYVSDFTEWRWLGLTDRIHQIYQEGRTGLGYYASFGLDLPKKKNSFEDLSIQFFFRNLASFDAAKRLSELGYLCEVAVILRSALEQFAYAEEIWGKSGGEDLESFRPNRSISWVKQHAPSIGKLYGLLSKYAHFEFDHHTHFFARSSETVHTLQRGSVLRAYATHLLFVTMALVSRYLLSNVNQRFSSIPTPVRELDVFVSSVKGYFDDVARMLPTDSQLRAVNHLFQSIDATD